MKRNKTLRIIAFLSLVFMITLNALANILPINGLMTGEISDSYFNLFAPTGLTFTIWGLIYLLLTMYALIQLKVDHDLSVRQNLFDDLALPFIISNLANGAWIIAWHYLRIEFSLALILIVFMCLLLIMFEINRTSLYNNDGFFIALPFSVYFGWISVATIANVTTLLVYLGYSSYLQNPLFNLGDDVWLLIVLFVGAIVMALTSLKFKARAYGLVFIWAYVGIYLKLIDLPLQSELAYLPLIPNVILGIIGFFVIILIVVSIKIKREKYKLGESLIFCDIVFL
jgi:hypothetical protein